MSHYPLLVIGEAAELKPYLGGGPSGEPEPWQEFFDLEDEYRERYENGVLDGPLERQQFPELCGKPICEAFPTFDGYMEAVYGPRDGRTGRYGDWWNPAGQFDWYEIGGRWSGFFALKPGSPRRRRRGKYPPGPKFRGPTRL